MTRNATRNSPAVSLAGFTLIEVVLGVAILSILLLLLISFHQQTAKLRAEVQADVEVTRSARLVMQHMTLELRCAAQDWGLRRGLRGERDRIEYLTTTMPSEARWSRAVGSPQTPEADRRWVGYRLSWPAAESKEAPPGSQGAEAPVVDVLKVDERAPKGIERTELRFLTALEAHNYVTVLPVTDALRFLRFRYFDGWHWHDHWHHGWLPRAVEVTVGAQPLPEGVPPHEYPFEIFRREIHLPPAVPISVRRKVEEGS